jgi:N-acetylmuramoyl-L-alanine amidase
MEIDFKMSPNFEVGRRGNSLDAFVLHVSEGHFSGSLSWLLDPKSEVSYHYLVKENGEITQLVEDKDTAWHAGKMISANAYGAPYAPNPNFRTIGIAYAGFAQIGPTFAQIHAVAWLIRHLSAIHTIDIDRNHIIAHRDIRADKTCPGDKFNFDTLLYLCSLPS